MPTLNIVHKLGMKETLKFLSLAIFLNLKSTWYSYYSPVELVVGDTLSAENSDD